MQPQVLSPDALTRLSPLGVRFWDEATHRVVSQGLRVIATPKAVWDKEVARLVQNRGTATTFPILPASAQSTARSNHAGLYVFQNLPGMRQVENGAGDDAFWQGPLGATKRTFVVAVNDLTDQFLPFTFEVELPYKGVFDLACDPDDSPPSPLGSPPVSVLARVPLLSAPYRPVSGGLAVLRADLWDLASAAPAAWALVRLTIQDPIRGPITGRGLADERGSLLALFPYPEPKESYPLSPPYTGAPLVQQSWDVTLEAYFGGISPQASFVDLCAALGQQNGLPGLLLATASPQVPLTTAKLQYGNELILTSSDSSASKLFLA